MCVDMLASRIHPLSECRFQDVSGIYILRSISRKGRPLLISKKLSQIPRFFNDCRLGDVPGSPLLFWLYSTSVRGDCYDGWPVAFC